MRGFDARGSWRAGRPPDLFDGRRQCRGGKFRLLRCAVGSGGDILAAARECWSWELEGRSPFRPLAPVRSLNRVDTDPHAALRALLVGLRPPTPQSPERLRSTPFDCVAIAPCCFAERKAVLSHALAALTALVPARKQGRCGNSARGAGRVPVRKQGRCGNSARGAGRVPVRKQGRCGNSARGADRACARENAVPLREFRSRR